MASPIWPRQVPCGLKRHPAMARWRASPFRVTGANGYDQTFKTDKNGEIFIEGLRVGDYTVSEVSDGASANYVLPADKTVTIFADKTTVAEMHNELRDTPKTGDDSKPLAVGGSDGRIRYGRCCPGCCGLCGQA